jgi:hypothetical protein
MIKYAREQFFLSANELVNSLQSKNSKSYWTFVKRMMKGTGNNYTIPPLYNGSTGELISELNQGLSFNLILTNLEGIPLTTISRYLCVPLYNGSTGELVYEDKAKVDLLNQYFCSITSINDSNRELCFFI